MNGKWRIISLIITLSLLGAGVVATWAVGQERQTVMAADVTELEDKTENHEKRLTVAEEGIKHILTGIDELKELVKKE